MTARGGLLALAFALALACAGCPKKSDPGKGGAPTATSAPLPAPDTQAAVAMDLLAGFDDCVLGHYGPLVDLGDPTARGSLGPRLRAAMPEMVERDGATWARVTTTSFALSVVCDAITDPSAGAPAA